MYTQKHVQNTSTQKKKRKNSGIGSVGISMSLLCTVFLSRVLQASFNTQKNLDEQVEASIKINLIDCLDKWKC